LLELRRGNAQLCSAEQLHGKVAVFLDDPDATHEPRVTKSSTRGEDF